MITHTWDRCTDRPRWPEDMMVALGGEYAWPVESGLGARAVELLTAAAEAYPKSIETPGEQATMTALHRMTCGDRWGVVPTGTAYTWKARPPRMGHAPVFARHWGRRVVVGYKPARAAYWRDDE